MYVLFPHLVIIPNTLNIAPQQESYFYSKRDSENNSPVVEKGTYLTRLS
jgi:hypothetical protein